MRYLLTPGMDAIGKMFIRVSFFRDEKSEARWYPSLVVRPEPDEIMEDMIARAIAKAKENVELYKNREHEEYQQLKKFGDLKKKIEKEMEKIDALHNTGEAQ